MALTEKLISKLSKHLQKEGESFIILHCKESANRLSGSVKCHSNKGDDYDELAEAIFLAASTDGRESPKIMKFLFAMNRIGAQMDTKANAQ